MTDAESGSGFGTGLLAVVSRRRRRRANEAEAAAALEALVQTNGRAGTAAAAFPVGEAVRSAPVGPRRIVGTQEVERLVAALDTRLGNLDEELARLSEELAAAETRLGRWATFPLPAPAPVEAARPRPPAPENGAGEHLLFVPGSAGYALIERSGPAPGLGTEVEVGERGERRYVVSRLGRAPLPDDRRPCAYLEEE